MGRVKIAKGKGTIDRHEVVAREGSKIRERRVCCFGKLINIVAIWIDDGLEEKGKGQGKGEGAGAAVGWRSPLSP